ncbi:lasso RiPP family leader peptide-containing protein [Propionibacterium acidifaciens]|uniref:lasso RiPP family leader peptide-containing protein n=1 Tax=Propionibacterium acidifaciens TaxID=556499 RepID=UPI0012DE1C96|nr:lasso RiPP family leader peptide-containing protein [Propionibacterium acidifaciens]
MLTELKTELKEVRELCYAQLNRAVEAARQEGGSDMYETPVLTRIADFADATNGAGHAPLKDVWGVPCTGCCLLAMVLTITVDCEMQI